LNVPKWLGLASNFDLVAGRTADEPPLDNFQIEYIVSHHNLGFSAQSAYPEYMQHFLGWPGAKAALGLGALSDRAATLAVWATLQFELAFALPLYAVRLPLAASRRTLRHAGGTARCASRGYVLCC
jgi:hypothetical protein